jgi:nucleoside-diphosphate-sugar epimerase
MDSVRCLVTGATGFVGSHVVEACLQRGYSVVTIARAGSDSRLLESLQVEVLRGQLNDIEFVRRAVEGVQVVIHCAAKVGDWGPVQEYRAANVEGLRSLLEDVRGRDLLRFVHLSSLGVYEARDHHGTEESVPPPARQMDGYTQSKVEAEALALQYHCDFGVPVTILRPGFIYGPRDRTVLPRLMEMLERRQVIYLGSGQQLLNTIYVGNLVDAIFLAIEKPVAVGQVYNLTDDEPVSKRRFMESIADLAGLDRPTKSIPRWLGQAVAFVMEHTARLVGAREAPPLTQGRLKFIGLNLHFSVEKAKRELGYAPRVHFEEGIEEAVTWWKEQQAARAKAGRATVGTASGQATVIDRQATVNQPQGEP